MNRSSEMLETISVAWLLVGLCTLFYWMGTRSVSTPSVERRFLSLQTSTDGMEWTTLQSAYADEKGIELWAYVIPSKTTHIRAVLK